MAKKTKREFKPKTGWIYVVTNECLKPVVVKTGPHSGEEVPAVKIGNAKEFTNRLGSLNTAVYENFDFHMGIKTDNVVGLEKVIHTALVDYQICTRGGDSTEFFACPLNEVISRIKKLVVGGHMIDYEEYKGGKVIGRSGSKMRANLKKQALDVNAKRGAVEKRDSNTKARATTFVVRFTDGTIIKADKAKDVYAQTISKLGVEKVAALGLKTVLSKRSDDFGVYANSAVRVDGWYVCTHSSTDDKIKTLKGIAEQLGVDIVVSKTAK